MQHAPPPGSEPRIGCGNPTRRSPGAGLSAASWITLPSPLAPPPLAVTHHLPAVPGMGYRVREYASSWSDVASPLSRIERERYYAVVPASTTFAVSSMAPLSVNPLDLADPVHPELTWSVAGGERGDQGTLTMSWGSGVVVCAPEKPWSGKSKEAQQKRTA